jgi:putative transposase
MRPRGSAQFIEGRRRRALRLLSEGRSLKEVARLVKCAASSVMRWRDSWRVGGEGALKVRSSPGRPRKLNTDQRLQLLRLLLKGARSHGFKTDMWTTQRIARVIERHFKVKYHCDHIGRLMHGIGWIHRRPQRAALAHHSEDCGPQIKMLPPGGWIPGDVCSHC